MYGETGSIVAVRDPSSRVSQELPFAVTVASVFDVLQVIVVGHVVLPAGTIHGFGLAEMTPVGSVVAGCTVTVVHAALQLLFSFDSGIDPLLVGVDLSAHARM